WDAMCEVIAERWDTVIDAVDGLIRSPEVDEEAVKAAAAELAQAAEEPDEAASAGGAETADDPVLRFWSEVGIDPIRITSDLGEHYTLRCYLDDEPVFLGKGGRVDVFTSPRALVRHLAEHPGGHDLDAVSTWSRVTQRAADRELAVAVDDANNYVLSGLADDLAGGPETVDPAQLELAVELITDAERWAGSDAADKALASSESLGWLVSFLLRPDPTRLAPSPPFDAEVAAWRALVGAFEDRLHVH
ncbi:MAG TPA: primosomal protein, partial [Pseudonocardiaceae bacterium]|nr:primosomal protein [Pseudonocardiaceae bacterium]